MLGYTQNTVKQQDTYILIRKSHIFFLLSIILFSPLSKSSNKNIIELLQEAEDYLIVKPSHSLLLLEQVGNVSKLSDELAIHWHIIRIRALVPTNQLSKLEYSLENVFKYKKHPYFIEKLPTILSATGIYLRKLGFLNEADESFICGIKLSSNDQQILSLLNSRALVARHLGDYIKAEQLYAQAIILAKKLKNKLTLATIANNMGAMAFDQNKFESADRYFRKALAGYQAESKRSGNITAGINLLFVFLIQNQVMNYQRLYPSIARLTKVFPNESKQKLLLWIHWTFRVNTGELISSKDKEILHNVFNELESRKVQMLVIRHLAPKLSIKIELPKKNNPIAHNLTLLDEIKQCGWSFN